MPSKSPGRVCSDSLVFCLRKLMVMERHGLTLTTNGSTLASQPPPPNGGHAQPAATQAYHTSHEQLTQHPNGWFTRLLRHPGVSPAFMAPLLALGIRHIGQLITASGTHIITSNDLALLPGVQKVSNRHKQALNRLTIALCGVPPPLGIKNPTNVKMIDPLPANCRTLPKNLSMPSTLTTRQGTKSIRALLSQIPPPLDDPARVACPSIPVVQSTRKISGKSLRATLQGITHKMYARENIKVGLGHIEACEVNDSSPPGMIATFWQQRQELTANIRGCDPHVTYWRSIASDPAIGWEAFRDSVCHPTQENPVCLPKETLASLYDPQFTISAITAGPLRYKYEGKTMECYRVSWNNTIVLKHHLPMIEIVYGHASSSHQDIVPSASTIQGAHVTCITTRYPSTMRTTRTQMPLAQTLTFVSAEWQDIYYPKVEIQRLYPTLLASYTAPTDSDCRPPKTAPPQSDTHLPDHIRQGIPSTLSWGLQTAWEVTRRVRSSVTIDLSTCNPDTDVVIPKSYTLQTGLRPPSQADPIPHTTDLTYSYTPSGTCVGRVTNSTLATLRAMYSTSQRESPEVHAQFGSCFEKDVARLLMRYDPDQKGKVNTPQNNSLCRPHRPSWALPDKVWQALRSDLGITRELFASPLDRSPSSTAYWTAHPEDQLFGANHDAYSQPWIGPCQANVGDSTEANNKAIRHALGSVATYPDEDTCIILFVPSWDNQAPHMRHLTNPRVHTILHLPAGSSSHRFKPPRHWLEPTPTDPDYDVSNPTLCVIAIATEKGAQHHLSPSLLSQFCGSLGVDRVNAPNLVPATAPNGYQAPPLPPGAVPKAIQRFKEQNTPLLPPRESPLSQAHPFHPLPCTFPLVKPSGRGTITAYTDGSCIKYPDGRQSIGAAIYFPADGDDGHDSTITINPRGKGPTLTINRAELSGIRQAITHSVSANTLHIYTDSSCSLHLIRRILNRPWTLRDSKHFAILNDTLEALKDRADRGQTTHFHKVRSHTGVAGNEMADKGAVRAAKDPTSVDVEEDSNNAPYDTRVWVAHANPVAHAHNPQEPSYVSNLTEDIKRKITPHHSGGQYTTSGLYAALWHSCVGGLHPQSLSQIWSDNHITWYQAILAFKARWGQLYNNKLAFRYKKAPNPLCPVCKNEPDSVGHLLGGCKEPSCKAMAIQRHNEAVRILQKAITKSSSFGGCYCVMDACPKGSMPLGVDNTRLPQWLIPADHPQAHDLVHLRPDLVFITGLPSNLVHGKSNEEIRAAVRLRSKRIRIHILEVGYCADTSHSEKNEEKAEQHAKVVHILTAPYKPIGGPDYAPLKRGPFARESVTYHPPITLGRTGSLPSSLPNTLKQHFRMGPAAVKSCMAQLTRHSASSVESFYKHRYAPLHGAPPWQHG